MQQIFDEAEIGRAMRLGRENLLIQRGAFATQAEWRKRREEHAERLDGIDWWLNRHVAGTETVPRVPPPGVGPARRIADARHHADGRGDSAVVEPAPSPAPTMYLGLGGTGVPVRPSEAEGRRGKQPGGVTVRRWRRSEQTPGLRFERGGGTTRLKTRFGACSRCAQYASAAPVSP